MARRARNERPAWAAIIDGVPVAYSVLPSTAGDGWTEPHVVKRASDALVAITPLSYFAAALLEMTGTHKAAELDTASSPAELRRPSVTADEIRKWHDQTISLARRLDMTPETRAAMRAHAARVMATHNWPAAFVYAHKVPANSKVRRGLRLTMLLWGLEQLRRAGDDVEGTRADSEALWKGWRAQLYDLFEGLPDATRPVFADKSLDMRCSRFEKETLIAGHGPALMVWLLNAALPIAVGRSQTTAPAPNPTR